MKYKNEFNAYFWDTFGAEKYRSITKSFIKGSDIVILIYDITRRKTFLELDFWINIVKNEIRNENVIFGIVGNKIDLYDESQVEQEEGEKKASEINGFFWETSMKYDPKGLKSFIDKLLDCYLLTKKTKE